MESIATIIILVVTVAFFWRKIFDYYLVPFWSDSLNFIGSTNRKEFWSILAFNIFTNIALIAVTVYINDFIGGALLGIHSIGSVLPFLALQTRRLTNAGRHPSWILAHKLPIGSVIYFFSALDLQSDSKSNLSQKRPLDQRPLPLLVQKY